MRRRDFMTLLGGAAMTWPRAARAQQLPAKIPRIGVLWSTAPSANPQLIEAFRQGLREHGYVEGQNVVVEHRWAEEGRLERLPHFAAELVRLKVDLIVAGAAPAAHAAKQATTTIPIVIANVGEAMESGFVASLARPGGNITGISVFTPQLAAKRLELLKEAVPHLSRIAVLWNATSPTKAIDWRETQIAARVLKLTVQSQEVRGPDDFERAFAAINRDRFDALHVLADPLMASQRARIIAFAAKSRLPTIFDQRNNVEDGGLIAYGTNSRDVYRRAAVYIDKILKGAKPADLPVEQPTKFELIINLKTAKTLGLTIPATVLARADEVIE
jgi:putative ABC transport system substrate-binding protein